MLASTSDDFDLYIGSLNSNNRDDQPTPQQIKYTGAIRKGSDRTVSALNTDMSVKAKVEHLPRKFEAIVNMINKGLRVCVILRGLPGSGKSFLAQQILSETIGLEGYDDHILSADKFFMRRGKYIYDPSRIQEAHDETQRLFTQRAAKAMSPLIVDNTNTEVWQMLVYIQVAVQNCYHIEILEPNTPWKSSEKVLVTKNTHSVPLESIRRMKRFYESGTGLQDIIKSFGLEMRTPLKRSIPPLHNVHQPIDELMNRQQQEIVKQVPIKSSVLENDLIDFEETIERKETKAIESPLEDLQKKPSTPEAESNNDTTDILQGILQVALNEQKVATAEQGTNDKNKLKPHRKNCKNENPSFAGLREFYPHLDEWTLWEFFQRCNGEAEWCANLLYEDNLDNSSKVMSGKNLTCSCDAEGNPTTKPKQKSVAPKMKSSPATKPKKNRQEANDEWLQTRELIEKSITIAPKHYPQHVNDVKNWKQGITTTIQPSSDTPTLEQPPPIVQKTQSPLLETDFSPDFCDELQAVPISNDLILELDEEYGGGLLRVSQGKLPTKVFIKRSTAHQLYLEIMEAFYSHEEETKLQIMKDDEELAKKLSEQEKLTSSKHMTIEFGVSVETPNKWKADDDDEDFAVKISKEKLIKLFPGLNEIDLMEIFKSANFDFKETVEQIKDSLNFSMKQRAEIDEAQRRIFNESWQTEGVKKVEKRDVEETKAEDPDGYTTEHLKTVEDLRQDIQDHIDEQKVCYMKAKEAIEKKNYELATYLSNIAKFHKMKAEDKKHEVANLIAGIHEKTHSSKTTLDLHYLNTSEAVSRSSILFDIFTDSFLFQVRGSRRVSRQEHFASSWYSQALYRLTHHYR